MKVMMVNGSPHVNGNTFVALDEMRKVFQAEGIETELVHIGSKDIRDSRTDARRDEFADASFQ